MLAKAQQDPLYSHYMYNNVGINPAAAGNEDKICIDIFHRNQWMNFVQEGAPVTTSLNIHSPFKLFGLQSGIGLSVYNDVIGFSNDIGFKINYVAKFDVGAGKLGIGAYGGLINNVFNPTWTIPGGEFWSSYSEDPSIPSQGEQNLLSPDFGAGIFYYSENIYFGLSSFHLTNTPIAYTKDNNSTETFYLKRKYYMSSGYSMTMSNPMFEMIPSVLIETDGVTSQMTLNWTMLYNKKIWGGVSYRTGNTFVAMFGMEIYDGIRFGVAYDYTLSDIQKYSDGSLEIMVKYCFSLKKEKTPQKYKSVRFL